MNIKWLYILPGIVLLYFFIGNISSNYKTDVKEFNVTSAIEPAITTEPQNIPIDTESEQPSFKGYPCTEDCSGHEAGYDWAEEKGIDNVDDCGGNSDSFIEGCQSYVEDNS